MSKSYASKSARKSFTDNQHPHQVSNASKTASSSSLRNGEDGSANSYDQAPTRNSPSQDDQRQNTSSSAIGQSSAAIGLELPRPRRQLATKTAKKTSVAYKRSGTGEDPSIPINVARRNVLPIPGRVSPPIDESTEKRAPVYVPHPVEIGPNSVPRVYVKGAKKRDSAFGKVAYNYGVSPKTPRTFQQHIPLSAKKSTISGRTIFPPHPQFTFGAGQSTALPLKSRFPDSYWLIKDDLARSRAKRPSNDAWGELSTPRMMARTNSRKDRLEIRKENTFLPAGGIVTRGQKDPLLQKSDGDGSSGEAVSKHGEEPPKSIPGRKQARKQEVQQQFAIKAAKKRDIMNIYESEESEEHESVEDIEVDDISDRGVPDVADRSIGEDHLDGPSTELLRALDALSLSNVRMHRNGSLPFLKRNLRVEAPQNVSKGKALIDVIYRYNIKYSHTDDEGDDEQQGDDRHEEYRAQIEDWLCPLCELHGKFKTVDMLKKHLVWDHSDVEVKWESFEGKHRIFLLIPEQEDDESSSEFTSAGDSSSSEFEFEPEVTAPVVRTPTPSVTPAVSESQIRLSVETLQDEVLPTASPAHLKFKFQPAYHASRSSTATSQAQSAPKDDLGPAARPPYLPRDGAYYSCRPGGERLYDLLNTLPLEKFGVMSWFVIDKEEEIFELDDVRDEDKVMMALWGRWILLNRNMFVRNYLKGAIAFVDEYWEMIKLAAGWAALRVCLLTLVVNRFLTASEVAKVLKHYEGLVGMN